MKAIVAFDAKPGAGKETGAKRIESLLRKDGFTTDTIVFSNTLRQILDILDKPHGRDNEQRLAQKLDEFETGALANAVGAKISKSNADVALIDGVRWLYDESMIRGLVGKGIVSFMIYVVADFDRRVERRKKRNRSGEADTTLEDFLKQDNALTEQWIEEIGNRADVKIENNGTIEEYLAQIDAAYETKIKPLLDAP